MRKDDTDTPPAGGGQRRAPSQHTVPMGFVDADAHHDGVSDVPPSRCPTTAATPGPFQCATRRSTRIVGRPDVDHPLRVQTPGEHQGSTIPPPLRHGSFSSSPDSEGAPGQEMHGVQQEPMRSHSPADFNSRDMSFNGAAELSTGTADAFVPVKPMRQHSVIVTAGKRYRPVASDLVGNRSMHPFSTTFEPVTSCPGFAVEKSEFVSRQDTGLAEVEVGKSAASNSLGHGSRSVAGFGTAHSVETPRGGREGILRAYLRGDTEAMQRLDGNDPINNFTFFVGADEEAEDDAASSDSSSSLSANRDRPAPAASAGAASAGAGAGGSVPSNFPGDQGGFITPGHVPFGTPSQLSISSSKSGKEAGPTPTAAGERRAQEGRNRPLDAAATANLVHTLTRSFAMQFNQRGAGAAGGELSGTFCGNGTHASLLRGGDDNGPSDESIALQEEKAAENYHRMPMHESLSCVSSENLEDDTVSLKAAWESVKAEALKRNVLFGFRVTVFAVMPTFVLMEHPKTSDFFIAGALLPLMAGLFVRPTVGAVMMLLVAGVQTVTCFLVWGIVMNAVGAKNNKAGWWCGVIFGCGFFSMFGALPAKRLMMMYVVIIMQTEHMPGGDTFDFVGKFACNFVIAMGFAVLATILPFPTFTSRLADEGLLGLHKLYCAGVGNAMKSFWAPVSLDAKMALTQIPFLKISVVTAKIRMAIMCTTYEPVEFNLNNTLRGQRVALLARIKMHLYAMSAASTMRVQGARWVHQSQVRHDIREFEKRLQKPAMDLAAEVMKVLVQLGSFIAAKDVAEKVSFDAMAEKSLILADIIERERLEMLFLRKLPEEETNACLGAMAFHFSLIDIANELQRFEKAMKTFDPAKYPSLFQRALNFFFWDRWNDFWTELPKRFTLSTPYDVRMLKDTIRYTGAFTVACAFTLNYDHENVYYFGMAILIRLAQQTASETLQIGIYRICGLCIGASLAFITADKTHNLAEKTLLTMTWVFIAMSFSQHPVYAPGAQYVCVTCIAGLRLAPTPQLLMTRVADNVFAFISYYVICTFIFPVDPIRVLWNTRTKCFMSINDLAQSIVGLGCAPITQDGKEGTFLLARARALVASQQVLFKTYAEWMPKCETEPTVRGGDYPVAACSRLRLGLNEVMSLEEALVDAMARLHRPREQPPGIVLRDMMELTRPFLQDAGRLIHHYLQCMIDATERWQTWSMEEPLHTMWKAQLACRSLHHVTGNIQRNFYAAVQQVDQADRQKLNPYLTSSVVEQAFADGVDPKVLADKSGEDLVQRILAMSFHMSKDTAISRDDIQAFNAIVIVFELLLKSMSELLQPMIQVYEYEKSRHV